MALPRGAMGLSAVCECGISCSYSLTILGILVKMFKNVTKVIPSICNDGRVH